MSNQPIDNSPGIAGSAKPRATPPVTRPQRGMALISGLLLLVVVTILAVSMFRSFGMQARIAGNTREKQRALHSAEGAQAYAEWYVSLPGGGNATQGTTCNAVVQITTSANVQVCSTMLDATTVTAGPWTSQGNKVGFVYQPPGMSTTGSDAYAQLPMFYIGFLSYIPPLPGSSMPAYYNYVIDATGTGGTSNTMAVVESTYQVAVSYTTQDSQTKNVDLSRP
jgi:type IV pilus assembly protein PilX